MKTLNFSIQINAPKEKVWRVLLDDQTYRIWTSAFDPSSYFEGDWSEGSKIQFLGKDGNGISSRIFKHVPNAFISIQHLGVIANGVENFESEWSGALENYSVNEHNGNTDLIIEIDVTEEHVDYFQTAWPQALAMVKALSEQV